MPTSTLPLNDHLCFALYGALHAMGAIYKPLLDPAGLTYPQYLVLLALWEQDGQTVGEIGARLHLASNTLTPLLKRMESAGLVRRTRNPLDERKVSLTLTPAGQDLQNSMGHVAGCILTATGLDARAVTDLQTRLMALRDQLLDATTVS